MNNLWALGSPRQEARWIFLAYRHDGGGDAEPWRELIDVSESEEAELWFLVDHGIVSEDHVEASIEFRRRVLIYFDRLVEEEETRKTRATVLSVVPEKVFDLARSEASREELQPRAASALETTEDKRSTGGLRNFRKAHRPHNSSRLSPFGRNAVFPPPER